MIINAGISNRQKKHIDKLASLRRSPNFKFSKETIKKMSLAKKGKPSKAKGLKRTPEQNKRNSESHMGIINNWKGGSWVWWQREIKKRDHFTCRKCGLYDPDIIEVAHIKPIRGLKNRTTSGHPLNNYDNLVTLCPNCHARFDRGIIRKEDIKCS